MNDREEARRLFERFAELNPDDVNVRVTLFELAKEMENAGRRPLLVSPGKSLQQVAGPPPPAELIAD